MGVESSIEHPTPILTFPLPGGRDRICAYPCLQLSAHNLYLQRIAAQDNGKPQLVSQLPLVCSLQRPTNFSEDLKINELEPEEPALAKFVGFTAQSNNPLV